MKIIIETIPHSAQRYPTVGDWQWVTEKIDHWPAPCMEPVLHIKVSSMSDWRYEVLVGLHEAIEALLCKAAGVTEQSVDAFDMAFEAEYPFAEPGDSPNAPYHKQHLNATAIETILAGWLGVNWSEYDSEVNNL